MHFVEIGKHPPVFADAAKVALELLQTPYEFDFGELYYNVFRSRLLFFAGLEKKGFQKSSILRVLGVLKSNWFL